MLDETIVPEIPNDKVNVLMEFSPSIDMAQRVLLLETKVLFLETRFKVLEEEAIKVKLEIKPQPTIYGANRKLKETE